jgi:iron complex outermembrane receptor protein
MNTHPTPWRLRAIATAAAAAGACPLATMAQTAPDTSVAFEPTRIVVTAPALGTLASRTLLTSVDTVGGAAINDAAVSANWELFSRVPGVQLTNFNQGTTSGKPSFRGFNGEGEVNAVKLLIDGVPSNVNDGNMHYLDLVVPLALQSVTAVRGTNDARYGLHNIAGNLELHTRQGGNGTDARIGVGPWGKSDVSLAVDREAGGFTQNLALGVRHDDGWRDHARADRRSLSGRWGWQPQGQDLSLALTLRAHRTEAEEAGYLEARDAYTTPRQSYAISATDGGTRDLGQAVLSAEGGQRSTLAWRALVYLNRFKDERFVRYSATASQQERDSDETHRGARLIVSWRPTGGGPARLCAGRRRGHRTPAQHQPALQHHRARAGHADPRPALDLRHRRCLRAGRAAPAADAEAGARLARGPGQRPLREPVGQRQLRHQRLRPDPAAQVQRRVVARPIAERCTPTGAAASRSAWARPAT